MSCGLHRIKTDGPTGEIIAYAVQSLKDYNEGKEPNWTYVEKEKRKLSIAALYLQT